MVRMTDEGGTLSQNWGQITQNWGQITVFANISRNCDLTPVYYLRARPHVGTNGTLSQNWGQITVFANISRNCDLTPVYSGLFVAPVYRPRFTPESGCTHWCSLRAQA